MLAEKLARGGERSDPLFTLTFRPAARMLAYLHPERTGGLVQIGAVEECMRQPVDQSKRHLAA